MKMYNLINKWAFILHQQDEKEMKTGIISTPFQDQVQYRHFLDDCRYRGYTIDEAENIWFQANWQANQLYKS